MTTPAVVSQLLFKVKWIEQNQTTRTGSRSYKGCKVSHNYQKVPKWESVITISAKSSSHHDKVTDSIFSFGTPYPQFHILSPKILYIWWHDIILHINKALEIEIKIT